MTRDLKALMDQASDRGETFAPDPAALVKAGRHRVRKRRITASLTVVAMAVVVAGSTAVAVKLHDPRAAAPATHSVARPQDAYKLCTTSNGTVLGADAWKWAEVVALSDQYGSASIRQAPKRHRNYIVNYAYCITQAKNGPSTPLGARGGVLVRKTTINAVSSVTTVFGRAYGLGSKVTVSTGDGKTGNAVAKSEFYLYRHVEARPWPGATPTVLARTFSAQGNLSATGRW